MFERFTERARQVVVLAQDEARQLGHSYIGTEHLLLGLLREEEGIAARALAALGITLDDARTRLVERVGRGEGGAQTGQIPFTPDAKKSLELALRNALSFRHNYIGTEHVLLGVVAADPSRLADVGVGAAAVRERVIEALGGEATGAEHALDTLPPDEPVDAKLDELRAAGWEIVSIRVERRRHRPTRE